MESDKKQNGIGLFTKNYRLQESSQSALSLISWVHRHLPPSMQTILIRLRGNDVSGQLTSSSVSIAIFGSAMIGGQK